MFQYLFIYIIFFFKKYDCLHFRNFFWLYMIAE